MRNEEDKVGEDRVQEAFRMTLDDFSELVRTPKITVSVPVYLPARLTPR